MVTITLTPYRCNWIKTIQKYLYFTDIFNILPPLSGS